MQEAWGRASRGSKVSYHSVQFFNPKVSEDDSEVFSSLLKSATNRLLFLQVHLKPLGSPAQGAALLSMTVRKS